MSEVKNENTVVETIKAEIENIRPFIQRDGGDIDYVSFDEGVVKVRLRGACAGCPGAQMTLKMGVEKRLKEVCPEVESVESA